MATATAKEMVNREVSDRPFSVSLISPPWFEAVQANIRRYGWQALAVRLTAIVLASLFMLIGLGKLTLLGRLWPLGILFLLWIQDGHCKHLQKQYVDLCHDARGGNLPDLAFTVEDRFNVAALWRPTISVVYVTLIVIIALANLGF